MMGLQGQICPETDLETWQAQGFPASLRAAKKRKAAGDSPCVSRPNVIKFIARVEGSRLVLAAALLTLAASGLKVVLHPVNAGWTPPS